MRIVRGVLMAIGAVTVLAGLVAGLYVLFMRRDGPATDRTALAKTATDVGNTYGIIRDRGGSRGELCMQAGAVVCAWERAGDAAQQQEWTRILIRDCVGDVARKGDSAGNQR